MKKIHPFWDQSDMVDELYSHFYPDRHTEAPWPNFAFSVNVNTLSNNAKPASAGFAFNAQDPAITIVILAAEPDAHQIKKPRVAKP